MRGAGPVRRAAGAVLALVFAGAAFAAPRDEAPVEPEAAFPLDARLVRDRRDRPLGVDLRFGIRDGYYLYKDRFRIEAGDLPAGAVVVPPGIEKHDPFVGPARIFRKAATLRLPFKSPPPPGEYTIRVTAQGCAEDRVCYAPFTQSARIRVP